MSVRRGRGCSREKWGSALLPLLLLQILKGTEIIILSQPSDPHTISSSRTRHSVMEGYNNIPSTLLLLLDLSVLYKTNSKNAKIS